MAQLEYWFASNPNGFYKFLAPCSHHQCRSGDSWVEELGFSSYEFRNAFDKHGVRYKSRKQLQLIVDSEEDPFNGKFYLSYIDTRNGLTFYLRNHLVLDEAISAVLSDFEPVQSSTTQNNSKLIDFNRNAVSSSPEVKKLNLQTLRNCTSGDEETQSPTNNTKTTTKNTAARAELHRIALQPAQNSAAVFLKNAKIADTVIGEKLTEPQQRCVHHMAEMLAHDNPHTDVLGLEGEIIHTLCDVQSFSQAGRDFFKKLNTIQKAIREGKWTTPAAQQQEKAQQAQKKYSALQQQLRERNGDHRYLQEMIKFSQKNNQPETQISLQKQMQICEQDIMRVQKKIAAAEQKDVNREEN